MVSSTMLFLWVAAAAELQTGAVPDALDVVAESSMQAIPAKMIAASRPIFPATELRKGKEAWVHITYSVDESGLPQYVSVLDSVGGSSFERAAVQSVKEWRFEPALVNGKPSWQSRTKTTVNFSTEDENYDGRMRVSRKFSSQFRKLGKLIVKNELQEADELFWKMVETSSLSLYEHSKLWTQRAQYEIVSGDLHRLDTALHRATASSGAWIDQASYVELLNLRVNVELRIGRYYSAFRAFDELIAATGKDSEDVLALQPAVDKFRGMIDGDNILLINAEVKAKGGCNYCNDSWFFTPLRNNFTFANVKGKLESIELRCDHKRFESVMLDDVDWHIPDDWGTCDVQVYGDPGTTFDLLLLPNT